MGIDTRFWGPSAWQLFHLVAFTSPRAEGFLSDIPHVLPCKFCRASTTEFVAKTPIRKPYGRWMYDIHNIVNHKLRTQCATDPAVINPGPDPDFQDIEQRYAAMKPNAVPGRDFLMAVAYNFPPKPEPEQIEVQKRFLSHLREAFPFEKLRAVVQAYPEPDLKSQKTYTKWMYGLMKQLSEATQTPIRSYRGYMAHLAYYKSGCSRKTYRGVTCRRTATGGRTKKRDHAVTRRVVHKSLLQLD